MERRCKNCGRPGLRKGFSYCHQDDNRECWLERDRRYKAKDKRTWSRKAKSKQRKKRRCLGGCGQMFMSEGPWNRICPECKQRSGNGMLYFHNIVSDEDPADAQAD